MNDRELLQLAALVLVIAVAVVMGTYLASQSVPLPTFAVVAW